MKAKTNNQELDSTNFKQRVDEIIQNKIRPQLNEHDGDIYVKEIKGGKIWVVFTGACKTCPAARFTIEDVVEKIFREELGEEFEEVYLVNEIDEELLDFAKKLLNKK
ncbi:NifU family protein [Odoribacter sp. OttesenSCG-928-G04]|nr:NifU family protein [Odoribacter sp. OttesenSCG-928-G04]MDL2331045.1 NifU family protein [Odoribacter sp. OttesenSCG-928-A06]